MSGDRDGYCAKFVERMDSFVDFLSRLNEEHPVVKRAVVHAREKVNASRELFDNLRRYYSHGPSFGFRLFDVKEMKYDVLEEIASGMIGQMCRDYFRREGLQESYFPKRPLHSFELAKRVVERNGLDVCVFASAKGFSYAPIVEFAGMNERSFVEKADISGKNVLVVEDCSLCRRLEDVCRVLDKGGAKSFSLMVGGKKGRAVREVPADFQQVHFPKDYLAEKERRKNIKELIGLLDERYGVFKQSDGF